MLNKIIVKDEKKLNIKFKSRTYDIKENKPIIFTKKVNNNCKTIPLNVLRSDIGQVKHFPPAAQE